MNKILIMKYIKGIIALIFVVNAQIASAFSIISEKQINISFDKKEQSVVKKALDLFTQDCKVVLSSDININKSGNIIVGTIGVNPLLKGYSKEISKIKGKKQAFIIKSLQDGKLLVAGSDSHGTAYGLMELSELIGVSPWEWWADVTPKKRESFTLPDSYERVCYPSVEYRGIFINDEDWGLMPWSYKNYEKSPERGHIGSRTNENIFELLLRLKANTYWPAMHECTKPFFLTDGNREMAAKYGIYIGGSHCEPMACSAAVERGVRGKGEYDYVNNRKGVYDFWESRVKDVAKQEILYTIGMRGVHDGKMQGANSVEEQKNVLTTAFKEQRELLTKYVNKDIERVPQVFIPYKEILDVYNAGLQVPDDVTLMWCDDNYGYIRHFPTSEENMRKGGNGIYYHVSYWGRPHDYLWLGTFSPYLLYHQLKKAYDKGIKKIWILNVGDIKPAEYQIELFMDMAWNIDEVSKMGVKSHLQNFLKREFGNSIGERIAPLMDEYYRLAFIRKPEFMGNTREEEKDPQFKIVKDLNWSEDYIIKRLHDYKAISDNVEKIGKDIDNDLQDAYFQLIKYPLQTASLMNEKHLYAQLARHGKSDWSKSDMAFDSIASLTNIYNEGINNNGKWRYMMDAQPRKLSVFKKVPHTSSDKGMFVERPYKYKFNAADYVEGKGLPCEGLGYEVEAVEISEGLSLGYDFGSIDADSVEIELCFVPTHPVSGDKLRVKIALDGETCEQEISYQTYGRSEEWKENVLNNRAIRKIKLPLKRAASHRVKITALDNGIVFDQLFIY